MESCGEHARFRYARPGVFVVGLWFARAAGGRRSYSSDAFTEQPGLTISKYL